ncbi:glycosyltransferase family 25 protein [Aliivibrio sp. S3MY1]|uniref:glycosyltransferase family 25 protein n=1 Tax=unclassified Aliivibrio TaxID=2645654 RepID=UPI0023796328|nr:MULTISPECIES: glycosyltransferase family 25 protein [unclassified Aliivibrio]MDD9196686.1 glycosyltransferase family 25 protein [Aliivibrio sp. S3MY1]MDD9199823.1 glycosyltransferase family 25 protein [Aliivibrio sp. S2MY1]
MKVFVISLKRSVDRRERIKKQLDDASIEFEFIDAVDASIPNFTYSERRNEALTRKRFGYKLLDSEIACFSSHHIAWERCLLENEAVLILEDNCNISEQLKDYIQKLEFISPKFDFLKLCATKPKTFKNIEPIDDSYKIIRYLKRTCGIMGYIITPKAANAFISKASQFIEPVDDYMEKPYLHGITTYCTYPDLIFRAKIQSTIGTKRKDKTGITLLDKCYIESFRLYEQFKDLLVKAPY